MRPHLWVTLSGHGFGHLAQTAPVINQLFRRMPELRVTIQSTLPQPKLKERIEAPFEYVDELDDLGMAMVDPFEVDLGASVAAYTVQLSEWPQRLARQRALLARSTPQLLLSNVSHLAIAAAAANGISTVALCSLNWADILEGCLAHQPMPELVKPLRAAYRQAETFLAPTPCMPMTGLDRLVSIGPIAALGTNRRREIVHALGLPAHQRLVLVTLGGIHGRLPMERWPRTPGITWLVPTSWRTNHPDALAWESLGLGFLDGLSSCDALLTKPGYGSFVEAACAGVPVAYVARPRWPEAPALVQWLQAVAAAREVRAELLNSGNLLPTLDMLWSSTKHPPVDPCGVEQAVDHLAARLD